MKGGWGTEGAHQGPRLTPAVTGRGLQDTVARACERAKARGTVSLAPMGPDAARFKGRPDSNGCQGANDRVTHNPQSMSAASAHDKVVARRSLSPCKSGRLRAAELPTRRASSAASVMPAKTTA